MIFPRIDCSVPWRTCLGQMYCHTKKTELRSSHSCDSLQSFLRWLQGFPVISEIKLVDFRSCIDLKPRGSWPPSGGASNTWKSYSEDKRCMGHPHGPSDLGSSNRHEAGQDRIRQPARASRSLQCCRSVDDLMLRLQRFGPEKNITRQLKMKLTTCNGKLK